MADLYSGAIEPRFAGLIREKRSAEEVGQLQRLTELFPAAESG